MHDHDRTKTKSNDLGKIASLPGTTGTGCGLIFSAAVYGSQVNMHPFLLVQIYVDVLLLVVESCSFLNDTAQLHSKLSLQPIANAISPPTDTPLKTAAVPESKRRDSQKAQGFQHGSTRPPACSSSLQNLAIEDVCKNNLVGQGFQNYRGGTRRAEQIMQDHSMGAGSGRDACSDPQSK